ncbi:hypothetical protein [Hymenobacter pini]|uniref:hypothetical protein n=1 Tax=Hymenobacter pini TaxID=2880879 RepID=UPI001CF1A40F|nr:hypothetical protein [Hymenobacter pini]MCA8830859.1 hypothetical protein [Hymenobacter pini]
MESFDRVKEWIEAGKQVGKSDYFNEGNERYLLSIGVQKWDNEYKLYLFKANEAKKIDLDYYDIEGVIRVTSFRDLVNLINMLSPFKFAELAPIKGQKMFNPALD